MKMILELLNSIYEKFSKRYYEIFEEMGEDILLSERDIYYLSIIYRAGKINLTQFSNEAKISKPAGTKIINKYLKKNYIIKKTSEIDKRFSYIELTNEMIKYIKMEELVIKRIHEEYLLGLSNSEKQKLKDILVKIDNGLKKK